MNAESPPRPTSTRPRSIHNQPGAFAGANCFLPFLGDVLGQLRPLAVLQRSNFSGDLDVAWVDKSGEQLEAGIDGDLSLCEKILGEILSQDPLMSFKFLQEPSEKIASVEWTWVDLP